jgi:hypothetical protein
METSLYTIIIGGIALGVSIITLIVTFTSSAFLMHPKRASITVTYLIVAMIGLTLLIGGIIDYRAASSKLPTEKTHQLR